jgi:hypothetical protein
MLNHDNHLLAIFGHHMQLTPVVVVLLLLFYLMRLDILDSMCMVIRSSLMQVQFFFLFHLPGFGHYLLKNSLQPSIYLPFKFDNSSFNCKFFI